MPNQLLQILDKMVKQERWRKKPKVKGILIKKENTKSGNIKLTLNNDKVIFVLKKNPKLYEKAETLTEEDLILTAGRIYLGKYYCEKLDVLTREKEKQLTLV